MTRRRSTAGVLIGLTLLGLGCVAKPEFTGRVTVLTYDADDQAYLTSDMASLIRKANADVVCVQEARDGWCRDFKRQFREEYPESLFAKQGIINFDIMSQPAFFSKYALHPVQYVRPLEKGWTRSWIVEADTPAGPVQIANVVLESVTGGLTGRGAGFFGFPKVHEREVDGILDKLPADAPTMIVGNFNGNATDPGVQRARERGFSDALTQFDSTTPTWRGTNFGASVSGQRDHILCSSHFEPVSACVLSTDKSGHSPVLVELKLVEFPTTAPVVASREQ